ncbi:MAG: class I adenylate-forming enzyme family protein [Solirubrobacteraceae bacterium]
MLGTSLVGVAALCRGGARRAPERVAVEWEGGAVTFAELDKRTDALARHLQGRLSTSARVGVYCENRVEWIEAYVAAHKAGIPVVPINHRYRSRELGHILAEAEIGLLVHDDTATDDPDVQRLIGGQEALTVGEQYDRVVSESGPPPEPRTGREDAIIYTSGTTSLPKGVVYTRETQLTSVFIPQITMGYDPSDRFLLFTPLAHRAAQPLLLCALILGASTYLLQRYTAEDLASAVQEHGITALTGVPTAVKDLLGLRRASAISSLPTVRHVLMSGESMPASLLRELMDLCLNARLGTAYGSTEAGLVTFLDHEHQLDRPRSCGRPLQGVQIRLADDGAPVGPGEPGEVLVRAGEPGSYTVAAGYLSAGETESFVDEQGWFHTGDVAEFDRDGFMRIVDRKKDMILSGGMNIASKEVEEVIAAHPSVAEVAVTGEPDERFGERVVAWIVPRDGASPPDPEEIVAHVVARAAGYKKPRVVHIVPSLPRSASGKVLKRTLKALDPSTPQEHLLHRSANERRRARRDRYPHAREDSWHRA